MIRYKELALHTSSVGPEQVRAIFVVGNSFAHKIKERARILKQRRDGQMNLEQTKPFQSALKREKIA